MRVRAKGGVKERVLYEFEDRNLSPEYGDSLRELRTLQLKSALSVLTAIGVAAGATHFLAPDFSLVAALAIPPSLVAGYYSIQVRTFACPRCQRNFLGWFGSPFRQSCANCGLGSRRPEQQLQGDAKDGPR
jgi:hypothetical protein